MQIKSNLKMRVAIPVVSMTDIAFLLLIFFMVTTMVSPTKKDLIVIPKIEKPDKVKLKKTTDIFIDKTGKYFFLNKEISLEKLKIELGEIATKDSIIFIYGDENTEYSHINQIIETLKELSLRNCVFICKKV